MTVRIDPKLGRRVSKEEALQHLKACEAAGLIHLIGRNKIDAVWLHVKPGQKLLSICHCCPCCCLWRMLPNMSKKLSSKVQKMPGVLVTVTDHCVGCKTCTKGVCFVNAITVKDNRASINADCRGCGRCVEICPQHAIEITISNPDFINESISQLDSLVDVT